MKTALAIVCSLVLLWTQFVQAQARGASDAPCIEACCCPCSQISCCAPGSEESQPVSATPSSSSFKTQIVTVVSSFLAWNLPDVLAREIPSSGDFVSSAAPVPLYQQNCAWLI